MREAIGVARLVVPHVGRLVIDPATRTIGHRQIPIKDELQGYLRAFALEALRIIGVSGEPPDPATSFSELGSDALNTAWLSGAVHPLSLRSLAAILVVYLPKESLRQVGAILLSGGCEPLPGQMPSKVEAIHDLIQLQAEGLNEYPEEAYVSINPNASSRQIEASLQLQLKQWKSKYQLPERRDRSDKYDQYLSVWDLREGWSQGTYDHRKEKSLPEISKLKKQSVSKTSNQYYQAFELVIGHEYSPELWWKTLGTIKLLSIDNTNSLGRLRPTKSPTRRPVPVSKAFPTEKHDFSEPFSKLPDAEFVITEIMMDVQTLIEKKYTDKEISDELECSVELVEYLRTRPEILDFEGD